MQGHLDGSGWGEAASSCTAVLAAVEAACAAVALARPHLAQRQRPEGPRDGGVEVEAEGMAGVVADGVADSVAECVFDGEDLAEGESVIVQRGIQC